MRPQAAAVPAAPPAAAASVELLKRAAADGSVPPREVFAALRTLEQAKVPPSPEWGAIVGGASPPGHRWRLVFTSGTKQVRHAPPGVRTLRPPPAAGCCLRPRAEPPVCSPVCPPPQQVQDALKAGTGKGGGSYFPLTGA